MINLFDLFKTKTVQPDASLSEPRITGKAMTELDRLADFARDWIWEEALKIAKERSGDTLPVVISEIDLKQITISVERDSNLV